MPLVCCIGLLSASPNEGVGTRTVWPKDVGFFLGGRRCRRGVTATAHEKLLATRLRRMNVFTYPISSYRPPQIPCFCFSWRYCYVRKSRGLSQPNGTCSSLCSEWTALRQGRDASSCLATSSEWHLPMPLQAPVTGPLTPNPQAHVVTRYEVAWPH